MRGGGHDVAKVEGLRLLLGGDEAADVRHVHHEHRAALVGDLAELGVVPVARVRRAAANQHLRPEVHRLLLELNVVDQTGGGVELVRQRLKEDGRRADLFHAGGVVAVREVPAGGQIEAHDAVVRG